MINVSEATGVAGKTFTCDGAYIRNPSTGEMYTASGVIEAETTDNKVTVLSAASTDEQYPSAKCVYDLVKEMI